MSIHIDTMLPTEGPTIGGNVVRFAGEGFDAHTTALFDGRPALNLLAQQTVLYVQAPAHVVGSVPVVVVGRDGKATPNQFYSYVLPALAGDSRLTSLVRSLLQDLKRHFIQNTSITVDVEAASHNDSLALLATLPALVLSGPEVRQNRIRSVNSGPEVQDAGGNFYQYPAPFTADLRFSLTGASRSTVELLNMLDAAVTHLHTAKWASMPLDKGFPELGNIRWPLSLDGDARVNLDSADGIRSFSLGLLVEGLDIGFDYPTSVAGKTLGARIDLGANRRSNDA